MAAKQYMECVNKSVRLEYRTIDTFTYRNNSGSKTGLNVSFSGVIANS